ncbi:MAG: carboxypeptidase regulatory-like domain-containing protein [Candidatus Wallbacteria bacterium]|nr:carboxypeptidase regulatory-like domain-containing protein [Candidatus Wallbacteria bacterium]
MAFTLTLCSGVVAAEELRRGLNLVGVPNPPFGLDAAGLTSLTGALFVASTESTGSGNEFRIYLPGSGTPAFPIRPQKGYLLAMPAARQIALSETDGVLQGRLVTRGSVPESGAFVYALGQDRIAVSGADGRFSLPLPAGAHEIRVRSTSGRTISRPSVTVTSGTSTPLAEIDVSGDVVPEVSIVLAGSPTTEIVESRMVTLQVVSTDAEQAVLTVEGAPLENVEFPIYDFPVPSTPKPVFPFLIRQGDPNPVLLDRPIAIATNVVHTLDLRCNGPYTLLVTLTSQSGLRREVRKQFGCVVLAGAIRGRLVTLAGDPVPNQFIRLRSLQTEGSSTNTSANGDFEFTSLRSNLAGEPIPMGAGRYLLTTATALITSIQHLGPGDLDLGSVRLNAVPLGALATTPAFGAGGIVRINRGDSVRLDASGSSDPDGDALLFTWSYMRVDSLLYKYSFPITSSKNPVLVFTPPSTGVYKLDVLIADSMGALASGAAIVAVR